MNSGRPNSAGFQPMPASCVQPNTSPLGASRSNSSVSGRRPAGPAALVRTSKRAGSEWTREAKAGGDMMGLGQSMSAGWGSRGREAPVTMLTAGASHPQFATRRDAQPQVLLEHSLVHHHLQP